MSNNQNYNLNDIRKVLVQDTDTEIASKYTNFELASIYYTLAGTYDGLKKYSRIAMVQQIRDLATQANIVTAPTELPETRVTQQKSLVTRPQITKAEVEKALATYDEYYDQGGIERYHLGLEVRKGEVVVTFALGKPGVTYQPSVITQLFRQSFEHALQTQTTFEELVEKLYIELNVILEGY